MYIEAPALHWRGRCLALAWKTWHVNVVASPEVAAYWAAREKREQEAAGSGAITAEIIKTPSKMSDVKSDDWLMCDEDEEE